MKQSTARLIKKSEIAKDIYEYWLDCKEIAQMSFPGQFLMVKIPGKTLRRPISICNVLQSVVVIVFEVRGEGTKILSEIQAGANIDIVGSLGSGFPVFDNSYPNICLTPDIVVGGGIGTPPLLFAAGDYTTAILGYRTADRVILETEFKTKCEEVFIMTDDGSYGQKGFVTEILQQQLIENKTEIKDIGYIIYACGPMAMLVSCYEVCKNNPDVILYVSLEERMGCGLGACAGCSIPVYNSKEDITEMKRICKDGPVFLAQSVFGGALND